MSAPAQQNDWLTVAAIGLLAMCVVTLDHEALGHGGVCLLLHGHIVLLTSSLFRCDVHSGWIDPAGPAMNLIIGLAALAARTLLPARFPKLRLFLVLVTALSFFWEGGYLVRAMLERDGDLYFFAQFLFGNVSDAQRLAGALAGVALFVVSLRLTTRALLQTWPDASMARSVARTAWIGATLGAGVAAFLYTGPGWQDLRDAVLEIGVASLPLLVIPARSRDAVEPPNTIARSYAMIALSAVVYLAFSATLGRGIIA